MRITPIILVGTLLMLLPMAARAEQSIAEWEAEGIALEQETGIPPFRLPDNMPPQDAPTTDLVHCTAGVRGRSIISIWLKRPDCDAWLKASAQYDKKYGAELEAVSARDLAERENAEEAKRQQNAGPGRRIIYAVFLCFQRSSVCQIEFTGVTPDTIFSSLAECEQFAQRVSHLVTPPMNGRF